MSCSGYFEILRFLLPFSENAGISAACESGENSFYLECIMRILKRGQKPAGRTAIWNAVEQLEPRMLLSASAVGNPHPDLKVLPFDSSSSISGFSPAEIRKAYGFDQL